jgi:hydroxyacylglutathione hydrolase
MFTLGPFETNCYVVWFADSAKSPDSARKECWIVDASFEPDDLIAFVKAEGLTPVALVLTHAHVDHIAGVADVRRAFAVPPPVWIHEAEKDWLGDPLLNLSGMSGMPVSMGQPDALLHHGDVLTLAGRTWRVLHTPGHSPGGISLVHDDSRTALVGDALFAGSVGRSDFPGSDSRTLAASIRERLYTLPDETTIWPGHGPSSTIGREKRTNPFVRGV